MKRLRNWLIRKFGGTPNDEILPNKIINSDTSYFDFATVQAVVEVPQEVYMRNTYEVNNYAKRELIERLSQCLLPDMRDYVDYPMDRHVYAARIKIAKKNVLKGVINENSGNYGDI